jgi:WXXGXW repeat (2 copies)
MVTVPVTARAQIIDVNITIAPPELPIYEQPPLPAMGYIWMPGYWAWGPDGYFWVPGTWVLPPQVGLLWTPGYWGWRDGIYAWNAGYWGPHIGFYGGVNYGFGYTGAGYAGGRWNGGVFVYNSTVNNFGGVHVTNVYRETVVVNSNVNVRVSFNGGNGGTTAQPTPQEQAAAHEQHVPPTAMQTQHQQMASSNKDLLASQNHGQPAIAATTKPAEFSGKGVVAAREARPNEGAANSRSNGPATTGSSATGTNELDRNGVKTPAGNQAGPPPAGGNPSGTKELDKRGGGNERATLGGSSGPKTVNTESKPASNNPAPHPVKPNPPQPHVASAPHPGNGPHPQPSSKEKKHD